MERAPNEPTCARVAESGSPASAACAPRAGASVSSPRRLIGSSSATRCGESVLPKRYASLHTTASVVMSAAEMAPARTSSAAYRILPKSNVAFAALRRSDDEHARL
eukprot:CAMPEP_0119420924 /NCGR_PEP_ID=MMETSP1335-20130426/24673_1 /TAXON_ID=259385 /ORGANISM="Chrysoculter rhomboideus, Strain RCC1486" /LENGTH=105 /DNA_ID=CAMNT_0007446303 /DNA_START=123 /DNA_END=435 /DNA_ORIENTATION=+